MGLDLKHKEITTPLLVGIQSANRRFVGGLDFAKTTDMDGAMLSKTAWLLTVNPITQLLDCL